jgi:nitrite transporter NirC
VPISIPDALSDAGAQAATKAAAVRRLPRYLLSAGFAGAYVGVAVVLLVSVAGPLAAAGSPFAKLVAGAVFGLALVLVVFAGAELFTGNAMVLIQGALARTVRGRDLAAVWVASLFGNLVGSVALAGLIHGGGSLTGDPAGMIASLVDTKNAASGPQLLWRSVLCNLLVCLALWMAARTRSDGTKIVVLWWALFAFIAAGFEHSVANMTIYSLDIFAGGAHWADLARNLAWTVPGNVIGGGVLVGAAYSWLGQPKAEPVPAATPAASIDPMLAPGVSAPEMAGKPA